MLDSCYRVLTPEGLELSLVAAGPAPRLLAWLVDLLIQIAGYITLLIIFAIFLPTGTGYGIFLILIFLTTWFYPVLFEIYGNGATPGKRWAKLRVLHEDGTPVAWRASMTRNLLLVVDFMPSVYAFGLCSMLLDRHFRRLGDLAAGTVVVYEPVPPARLEVSAYEPRTPPMALRLEEQRVVLEFAERCSGLSVQRQYELANLAAPLVQTQNAQAVMELRQIAAGIMGAQR